MSKHLLIATLVLILITLPACGQTPAQAPTATSAELMTATTTAAPTPIEPTAVISEVPIGTARALIGEEVVVEGIATMYTGGYYAGSGNTKFYLEDESGGIQIFADDCEGEVNISLGDKVRVRGIVEAYRGALELIPASAADVTILEEGSQATMLAATPVGVPAAATDIENLPGKLIQAEGMITRVEELSYSYEIDLTDEAGHLLNVYVDKLTNISVEAIESGDQYRLTGIIEVRDAGQQMYPRVQADLEKIYPSNLRLEIDAPNTVAAGEIFGVSLTVYNHTPNVLTNVVITAPIPRFDLDVKEISDDGVEEEGVITWAIPELAGDGGAVGVSYQAQAIVADEIRLGSAQAAAAEWSQPAESMAQHIFLSETVPIWAIQGESSRSPYIFDQTATMGVVSGVFPELGGFWIQAIDDDNDPATSDGLFVNTGGMDVAVAAGDWVQVSGVVREAYQQTQLQIESPQDVEVQSSGHELPAPVELNPPSDEAEAEVYYEALEGMFVQVTGPAAAVAPLNHYGEYALVQPDHEVERLWQHDAEQNGMIIIVDDGSSTTHDDRSTLAYTVNVGDSVGGLVGPLAYTYGHYKLEAVTMPTITPSTTPSTTATASPLTLPIISSDEFSLMTWNVENLFDFLEPNPASPPMPSIDEYKLQIAKSAHTILAAGAPTLVGLQEVENIGVLEDIAAHESLAGYDYQPVLIEGSDSRGIDVGYLVRGDQATVINEHQYIAPGGLTSRPPLLVKVEVMTDSGSVVLNLLNNHFTSMSGGVEATEPRRAAQAAWNVTVLEELLAKNPDAYVAVMGDLNSYYDSLPIDTLRDAGLIHVFEMLPENERYTYIYQGQSQVLDHILITPSLLEMLRRVDVLHVNADYTLPDPADESPMRKSDHDPVVVVFSLEF
ncbi:MAG: endonuclease/exonuclease/phosphatase family protein [Chloroflexota bacterium]|nr:endonuclease/exonuclease/phosphatase family protein [Chloroflexota bacterium]